jgi:hypothetical protein
MVPPLWCRDVFENIDAYRDLEAVRREGKIVTIEVVVGVFAVHVDGHDLGAGHEGGKLAAVAADIEQVLGLPATFGYQLVAFEGIGRKAQFSRPGGSHDWRGYGTRRKPAGARRRV